MFSPEFLAVRKGGYDAIFLPDCSGKWGEDQFAVTRAFPAGRGMDVERATMAAVTLATNITTLGTLLTDNGIIYVSKIHDIKIVDDVNVNGIDMEALNSTLQQGEPKLQLDQVLTPNWGAFQVWFKITRA